MDITAIKPKDSIEVVIKHPGTSKPTGLVINIVHTDDDRVKSAIRRLTNKRLKARNKVLSADEVEEGTLTVLCAAIVGVEWRDDATFNGETPEYSPELARKLMEISWIREQVDLALGDVADFFTT